MNETLFYVLFKILFTASNVQGDFSRIRHRLRNHCSARKNFALSSLFLRALFKSVGDALLGRNVASVGRRLLEEIAKRLPFKHTSCSCNTKGLVLFSFLSDSFDVQRPLAYVSRSFMQNDILKLEQIRNCCASRESQLLFQGGDRRRGGYSEKILLVARTAEC